MTANHANVDKWYQIHVGALFGNDNFFVDYNSENSLELLQVIETVWLLSVVECCIGSENIDKHNREMKSDKKS